MLTTSQLRQSAALSGVRDIGSIEIDVLLTHLLQLFHEKELTGHLAFKGGTFLRKMVFGPRGRLSTDLDFTCRTDISLDDLTLRILEALDQPYHGIAFRFDRDKDWYLTEDGCAANPVCVHEGNMTGVKIKIQVSMRERPVLPVREMPQIDQSYFSDNLRVAGGFRGGGGGAHFAANIFSKSRSTLRGPTYSPFT
jgi:predicted nucleotidyltransferase component of viral defense system